MSNPQLDELQLKLNYRFNNIKLLSEALTHSSYANEKVGSGTASNERLEFLGDSLLGMIVAVIIYESKPTMSEGQMTKLRAELVCESSLAKFAHEIDLGTYLYLGHGESKGGGHGRPSILSDAFEAVIAAMYLDGGFEPIQKFIENIFVPHINTHEPGNLDYKTRLQEYIHSSAGQTLTYELVEEIGPAHNKFFTFNVNLNEKSIGTGSGKSKKAAEQDAAKAALILITNKNH